MLRVNRKTEYAIIALLQLASEPGRVASVRELSQTCHIPETLLSKIMQRMKNMGIVGAVHGKHGGYRLRKGLGDITLLDVNQALVGPVRMVECLEQGVIHCPVKDGCTIFAPMNILNQKLVHLFQSTSLEALAPRKVAL